MQYTQREEDEWALAQILTNPVLFREFINEGDPDWKPLEQHERAWTACESSYMSMCCGRSVHKTTAMIEMLYYWVINRDFYPGDPGLFVVVPNKAQKDLTFPRIRSACTIHWLISKYTNSNSINVSEGRIDFTNGFSFIMRIAGSSGTEANVIGLHTFRIWVDEAQDFPYKTWLSLQNSLKFELPNHRMVVSGVPNGERKNNVLYECDQLDDKYTTFNISQEMMSWWTPEIEYMRRKQYSALQEDSEDYKHFVLGQHGVPTFAIFDRVRFLKEDFETLRTVYTQAMFEKAGNQIDKVIIAPPLPIQFGTKPLIGLGYDVGYSPDPAVFFIMYRNEVTGIWRNLLRVVLQRVEYMIQRQILMWLDKVYNFDFIGMDMGGPGKVQYQDLTSELADISVRDYDYINRLYPVEFGGYMVVSAHTDHGELIEKKDLIKRIGVETVSRWVQESHRFAFSKDDENLMDELERTKFSRNAAGDPIYKTDDDHQFAAMMCAILAYENRFGTPLTIPKLTMKPKLIGASWLDPYGVL